MEAEVGDCYTGTVPKSNEHTSVRYIFLVQCTNQSFHYNIFGADDEEKKVHDDDDLRHTKMFWSL
ncbi:hypothetical protein AM593_10727, partial [Mytilus galloprovincialis]